MRTYDKGTSPLRYAQPSTKCLVLGCLALAAGLIFLLGYRGLAPAVDVPLLGAVVQLVGCASAVCLSVSVAAFVAAVSVYFLLPDSARIRNRVRRGLFYPGCGNPLGLKDGELLPSVRCTCKSPGVFELTVIVRGCPVERVANAAPSISTALNGRFTRYAVTQTNAGIAFDKVVFQIENVMADKSLTFHAVEEMRPKPTKLRVQQDVDIDLTTSGSMLVAGKTRSGKTTGIISLLIQVLLGGRDKYGSEVIIIDPKQAELSRLPHVVTLDEDGEATQILEAMEHFAATITQRQKVLNELSAEDGDAAKWWDANFHCSLLFLDEYVACRSVFPTKASKDNPSYSLERFDRLFKRIVTMGASAGCYTIVSIAEASVQEGGLPSMLRSAMSTKILFRPTLEEGRLLWGGSNEKLKNFSLDRVYKQGDAWFSSTDGEHDNVSFVHFPRMKFKVYRELGRLLNEYYAKDKQDAPPPAEA